MALVNKKNNAHDTVRVSKRSAYYTTRDDLDTVVFVHGLGGHYQKTWGKFPELLVDDPDLPTIDILMWGFASGMLRPLVHDTQTVGRQLLSAVGTQITDGNSVYLVGHSMGGLIILEGLVDEMRNQRAAQHPSSSIAQISLYASPVSGSMAAAMLKQTLGRAWMLHLAINKHLRSLARGTSCDRLLTETHHRIYDPESNDSSAREIPIRMVMGTRDRTVSDSDRHSDTARFRKKQPKEYDCGHFKIKEPESHLDERYRALAVDLQEGFATRFHEVCQHILSADDDLKTDAEIQFVQRYERLIVERFETSGMTPEDDPARYEQFIRLIVKDGAKRPRPPFDVANRALVVLRARGVGAA